VASQRLSKNFMNVEQEITAGSGVCKCQI
jgi:hypothetical protein